MSVAIPDVQPAASSPATDPGPVPDLATLSTTQRAEWRKTGTVPDAPSAEATISDDSAASSPAPAVAQPASTEASSSADSKPATGKGVKARSAELDAEIAALQDKLKLRKALRDEYQALGPSPDVSQAVSSPAPVPSLVDPINRPDVSRPMLSEDEFFARFPNSPYGQYGVYAAKYVVAQDRAIAQQQQQDQQRDATWMQQVAAARQEYPDFDVQIQMGFANLPQTPANTVIEQALKGTANARLAYHLATHREVTERLIALSPAQALLELGMIAGSLSAPAAPGPPAPKTVSAAPPPPPTLATRAQAPVDDVSAALAEGDFRRYRAAQNAREAAAYR